MDGEPPLATGDTVRITRTAHAVALVLSAGEIGTVEQVTDSGRHCSVRFGEEDMGALVTAFVATADVERL